MGTLLSRLFAYGFLTFSLKRVHFMQHIQLWTRLYVSVRMALLLFSYCWSLRGHFSFSSFPRGLSHFSRKWCCLSFFCFPRSLNPSSLFLFATEGGAQRSRCNKRKFFSIPVTFYSFMHSNTLISIWCFFTR